MSFSTSRATVLNCWDLKRDFSAAVTSCRIFFKRVNRRESFRTKRATSSATRKPSRARLQLASSARKSGSVFSRDFMGLTLNRPKQLLAFLGYHFGNFDRFDNPANDGFFAKEWFGWTLNLGALPF